MFNLSINLSLYLHYLKEKYNEINQFLKENYSQLNKSKQDYYILELQQLDEQIMKLEMRYKKDYTNY